MSDKGTQLVVKTTVEIPQIKVAGVKQGGVLYMALDDFAEWLDATAAAFDKAHAAKDIGGVIRACASAAREAKNV